MTALRRWLPAITQASVIRKSALGIASLAFVGGAVAGPVTAAQAAPAAAAGKPAGVGQTAPTSAPSAKKLDYRYQAQPNFYYCGPAATRIALTAQGLTPSQHELARRLGTTTAGTDSAHDITRVLNRVGKTDSYKTRSIPGDAASRAETKRLRADVVRTINHDRPVVANIIGAARDTDGRVHSFEGGHYVTIVGYRDDGRKVKVADPANINGHASYWMSTEEMADWVASRGYSA